MGGRRGDFGGLAAGLTSRRLGQLGDGIETPGRADQRPNPEPDRVAVVERLQPLILGIDSLGPRDHDAGI